MNMIPASITLTKEAEEFLEDLAASLEIPQGRYEQARDRYRSLGEWLHRDASTVRRYNPKIYAQGSFRLGTAIRPRARPRTTMSTRSACARPSEPTPSRSTPSSS